MTMNMGVDMNDADGVGQRAGLDVIQADIWNSFPEWLREDDKKPN